MTATVKKASVTVVGSIDPGKLKTERNTSNTRIRTS